MTNELSKRTKTKPSLALFISLTVLAVLLVSVTVAWGQQQKRQVPVDSLIFDLKNPDAVRRKDAAIQLGNNKIQRAVPDLVAAAGDSDPAVRREIVIALDRMADIRSLPAFVKLIGDSEKDIRDKCIGGITNLYLAKESGLTVTIDKVANFFNPWSDEWADIVVEPGVPVDAQAITALSSRLQDPEDSIRTKASRSLGILKGLDAMPAILECLRQDKNNSVRFEIVRTIRKIGDISVAPELMNYLSYNDSKIRNEAVYTIGRFRYRAAIGELARLFNKESKLPANAIDKIYREKLLDALAYIADPSSKELFIHERSSPDNTIRLRAFEGLARIGDPGIVTEISRERLNEKDVKVQTAQAYALYRMGRKEYLDALVKALASRKTNYEARQYLVEFRSEELPELIAQTKNNDASIREALAEILGLIGDSSAIPALQELSKDRRGQIASLANQGMRRINARTGKS